MIDVGDGGIEDRRLRFGYNFIKIVIFRTVKKDLDDFGFVVYSFINCGCLSHSEITWNELSRATKLRTTISLK